MASYIVTYDLSAPGRNYSGLIDHLKSGYSNWAHIAESTWIIVSSLSAESIRNNCWKHMDSNDKLFVIGARSEAAWIGTKQATDNWIQNNL